ncbi:MAG: hypothetical protein HC835_05230 [Oscillatoriales cyanobacterium RM2_1_1]|nr:hypothetical protein [Oscillatoriales cyanobacterium RM2_1_1]
MLLPKHFLALTSLNWINTLKLQSLTLDQLEFIQQGNHVRINVLETDEVLAVVQNVNIGNLSGSFV